MKEKPIGGKRNGAGRKPSANPKQPVTIFVETSTIEAYKGKDGFRAFLYEAIARHKSAYPEAFPKKFPPSDAIIKVKGVLSSPKKNLKNEKALLSDKKPEADLSPSAALEQGDTSEEAILKQIEAIRAEKIPDLRNKSDLGRKSWKIEQQKRIEELKQQLK